MATQEGDTTPVVPEFQLGVLLVHGIGTQRSGDTLVRWGDVLLKTIELATKDKVIATIERAGPSDGPGKGRFEAAVQFRTDDRAERWCSPRAGGRTLFLRRVTESLCHGA